VSQASQALWFDAVPLLVVAAAYLWATVSTWVGSRRPRFAGAGRLVFAAVGLASGIYGVVLAVEREAPTGGVWTTLAVAVVLALPLVLGQFGRSEPAAEDEADAAPVHGVEAVAIDLLDQVENFPGVEIACLLLVDDESKIGSGYLGRLNGRALDWFPEVRIDLEHEASGVATAVYEAAPFAVYDAAASKVVSKRLVETIGAKSLAFVPLIVEERVIAVLVAGAASERKAFTPDELNALQALARDRASALDRARSTLDLAEALERERFVARISARVRTELDIDEVLRVAVEETGRELGVQRCFIRLGPRADIPSAEWHVPPLASIKSVGELGVSNLALETKRTIVIDDIENAPELDSAAGGRIALLDLGTRAALAVPLIIFD
jgi:GAF domain-containing protein